MANQTQRISGKTVQRVAKEHSDIVMVEQLTGPNMKLTGKLPDGNTATAFVPSERPLSWDAEINIRQWLFRLGIVITIALVIVIAMVL